MQKAISPTVVGILTTSVSDSRIAKLGIYYAYVASAEKLHLFQIWSGLLFLAFIFPIREKEMLMLKPQDIVVLLKLTLPQTRGWSYVSLGKDLHISVSEVHKSLERCKVSNLYDSSLRRPRFVAFEELLIHGVKYVYPARRGTLCRGMPTSFAAPPLLDLIQQELLFKPVWPDPEGTERGYALEPLYSSVPKAAKNDSALYELLVLVDAIREGRAREQQLAIKELRGRLHEYVFAS